MNLLQETMEIFEEYNLRGCMVQWVGNVAGTYAISWDTFVHIACETNYDSGFGAQEIASDLVIVGMDWWLERVEYDGLEAWEYNALPTRQPQSASFQVVNNDSGLMSLKEMNARADKSSKDYPIES